MTPESITKGCRVRVRQKIHTGAMLGLKDWTSQVEGVVQSCEAEPTASWFAHGKNDRVWLLRIRLKKDDGEVTVLNLDESSHVTVLARPGEKAAV